MVEAISGAKPARQAILGDASNRNEKSDILTSCLLVGGVLFGHWRSDTLFPLVIRGATRRTVRKHRAPKGALRLYFDGRHVNTTPSGVRKHRAPKGALRLCGRLDAVVVGVAVSESTERQKVH